MIPPAAGRPWWKQRRWYAAVLLAALAYPASAGPAAYAVGRGWLSSDMTDAVYAPVRGAVNGTRLAGAWQEYRVVFLHAGLRHAAPE